MPFSRNRAVLTEDQMSLAEALDSVYDVTKKMDGGLKFRHILSVPQLVAPMSRIATLISRQKKTGDLVPLLLGAAAAFSNDNQ